MNLKEDFDFVEFKKFNSEDEFRTLFGGDYEYDTIHPLMGDIEGLSQICLRGSEIESVEPINGKTWFIGGEDWTFVLMKLTMRTGKEHLVLAYDYEIGNLPISK